MLNDRPLVSVYMPTHNRCDLVKRTVTSVLTQTYSHIELIVVDDASTDETSHYLASIDDSRVRVVSNPFSAGACFSRNVAISIARGDFVTGLDDDDYFRATRIADFVEAWRLLAANGSKFGFLYDKAIRLTREGEFTVNVSADADLHMLLGYNCVGSQVFCKRIDILNAGMFYVGMPAWQDWDMWVRLARLSGRGVNIDKISYVIDETHDADRISHKPEFVFRYAMELFCNRNKPLSPAHQASIRYTLCKNPRVRRTFTDCVKMIPLLTSNRLFWSRAFTPSVGG